MNMALLSTFFAMVLVMLAVVAATFVCGPMATGEIIIVFSVTLPVVIFMAWLTWPDGWYVWHFNDFPQSPQVDRDNGYMLATRYPHPITMYGPFDSEEEAEEKAHQIRGS